MTRTYPRPPRWRSLLFESLLAFAPFGIALVGDQTYRRWLKSSVALLLRGIDQ